MYKMHPAEMYELRPNEMMKWDEVKKCDQIIKVQCVRIVRKNEKYYARDCVWVHWVLCFTKDDSCTGSWLCLPAFASSIIIPTDIFRNAVHFFSVHAQRCTLLARFLWKRNLKSSLTNRFFPFSLNIFLQIDTKWWTRRNTTFCCTTKIVVIVIRKDKPTKGIDIRVVTCSTC